MTDARNSIRAIMQSMLAWVALAPCGPSFAVELPHAPDESAPPAGITASLEELEAEFVELNRDLDVLEHKLLYPPSAEVVVFVSVAAVEALDLESLDLSINGKRVAQHVYNTGELVALERGGVQRLFVGNIPPGTNRLNAEFNAVDATQKAYRKRVEIEFQKSFEPVRIQLEITRATAASEADIAAIVVH